MVLHKLVRRNYCEKSHGEYQIWKYPFFLRRDDSIMSEYLWNETNIAFIWPNSLYNPFKACVHYFLSIISHQVIVLQKLWTMFFISSKKLFSFLGYSNFCNFSHSFPYFPDSKGQMEVEQFMMSWAGLHKFAIVIFGITRKLLYITPSN